MFDWFTDRARKIMVLSRDAAQRFRHDYIAPEHVLLALAEEGSGVGASVLKNLDVDPAAIRAAVEALMEYGTTKVTMGQIPFTRLGKRTLEHSLEEAQRFGHTYIGSEHLLLGLLRLDEGIAAEALRTLHVDIDDVREEILELLGVDPGEGPPPAHLTPESLARWAGAGPVRDQLGPIEEALSSLRREVRRLRTIAASAGQAATPDPDQASREAPDDAALYVRLQVERFDGWLELLARQLEKLRDQLG